MGSLARSKSIHGVLIVLGILFFTLVGFYVRFHPFKNYQYIEKIAARYGLADVAKYSYLDANDPWIEYWLARYLHDHGISSWTSLTRDNPATRIFWYPWGRNFVHTEFPFIPAFGALTPKGVDVVEWVSLIPTIFGTLMVIVGSFYAWRLYGRYAALTAAALLSLLPASTARTYAGFVEKIGVAMPFLILYIYFYSEALRRRGQSLAAYIYALLAGVMVGSIAFIWGGYAIASASLAVAALLIPLAARGLSDALRLEALTLTASLTALAIGVLADRYGPASLRIISLPTVVSVLILVIVFAAERFLQGRPRTEQRVLEAKLTRYYTLLAIVLLVLGPILAVKLGVLRGRALFALAWPLREAGVLKLGRLAETVAEHSSPFSTSSLFRSFLWETNIMLFMAPIAFAYLLYRAFRRKEPEHLLLGLLAAGLYYAVLGMVYFEQAAAVVSSLAIASLAGFLTPRESTRAKAKRKATAEYGEIRVLAALAFLIIVAGGVIAGAYQTIRFVDDHVAIITGYGIHSIELGWLYFLHHLKHLPNNTVVVAWWDYGYQISVGGGKPSLADGATINSTQIRLLADFFTATSEKEASKILAEDFRLKPNETLVFIHDIVLYNPSKGILIYIPSIDIPKSAAMLHISGKDEKGFALINNLYRRTLIYRLFENAPYALASKGVVYPELFKIQPVKRAYIFWYGQLIQLSNRTLASFKPYLIILGPIFNPATGKPVVVPIEVPGLSGNYYEAVMLIVYRWVG